MPIEEQRNFSYKFYLFGLFLLAVSLPWSKFLMSNAQIILLVTWLADKNLLSKIKNFFQNKTALIVSSVFIMHLIGLLYTNDFNYASEDIRKKIPLLMLPLLFSTSPSLSKKNIEYILMLFVLSVTLASFVCFYVLLGYTNKAILQHRDASIFISHIRFSLLISLAFFILGYFIIQKTSAYYLKGLLILIMFWLLFFMLSMEMITGIACTGIIATILLFYFTLQLKNTYIKTSLILLLLVGIYLPFNYIQNTLSPEKKIILQQIPEVTQSGNRYSNDSLRYETENGYKVWIGVCEAELKKEWNKRSKISYDSLDLKKNDIKYTLIRFLTSKGLFKDSSTVSDLSDKEIAAIEKGIANINYMKMFNPRARIKQIAWEINKYMHKGNPSGHSVIQRFEYWKASLGIIKENIMFGVGTGDVEIAFANEYEKTNSPLTKEWRLRSHNQFMAIAVAFGLIGLLWFLFSLVYPILKEKKLFNYFYMIFFMIALLSFLTEDTLETQAGVTFFAFFNSFLLFCDRKTDHTEV